MTTGAEAIFADRLTRYLTETMRESRLHTSRTPPSEDYELAVIRFAAACLATPGVEAALGAFTELISPSVRVNVLGQKLIQPTMPGAPGLYQGCKAMDLSLVGPDNRRPTDYYRHSGVLTTLGMNPPVDLDTEELLVTSRALLLHRDHPGAFRGSDANYRSASLSTDHAVVFECGYGDSETPMAITTVTRVQSGLNEEGWGDAELVLPNLWFRDVPVGHEYPGGAIPLADILDSPPVALLVHQADQCETSRRSWLSQHAGIPPQS